MIFETLLLIGVIGFFALAFMGIGHHGGAGGHHFGGHHAGGHHFGGLHHGGGGHHGAGHGSHTHGTADRGEAPGGFAIPMWLSPLTLFTICLGMGLFGVLTQKVLSGGLLWVLALLTGVLMQFLVVGPFFALIMKFAGTPSAGLEGCVGRRAEVISAFDALGRGMVKIELDGQITQFLAQLEPAEVELPGRPSAGESVFITSVDAKRAVCRVTTAPELATDA